jgi:hypothetical protein
LDKLTQSLVASSTAQVPPEALPINLPVKQVKFDSLEGASFLIDEGIGKNTSFLVSTANPEAVSAELVAPNGEVM